MILPGCAVLAAGPGTARFFSITGKSMRFRQPTTNRREDHLGYGLSDTACVAIASMICGQKGIDSAWPMPFTIASVSRARLAVSMPQASGISGSASPWITSVGTRERAERLAAAARAEHRGHLARHAGRIEAPFENLPRALRIAGLVEREAPGPQNPPDFERDKRGTPRDRRARGSTSPAAPPVSAAAGRVRWWST